MITSCEKTKYSIAKTYHITELSIRTSFSDAVSDIPRIPYKSSFVISSFFAILSNSQLIDGTVQTDVDLLREEPSLMVTE